MTVDRHPSRILAMQALCHYDVQGGKILDALATLTKHDPVEQGTLDYARNLCEHYQHAHTDVDALISAVLQDRKLDRIDNVARNTVRVATIELLEGKTPPKVALNEAINIAREFACDETAKFVNGLLDPIFANTRKDS